MTAAGSPAGETLPLVIAIDGPAGSGKSSVAKQVARELGIAFLDTGAAYRALAWHVLEHAGDTEDPAVVVGALEAFAFDESVDPDDFSVSVGGVDVTDAIRDPRVTDAVSGVARVPEARAHLTGVFRELMAAQPGGVIAEGRDITTVVAPDARVRVLLTAEPAVRAARRGAELGATGADGDAVARALARRGNRMRRVVDFITAAPGVDVVDSTDLDFEQTVAAVLALVERATGEEAKGADHGSR